MKINGRTLAPPRPLNVAFPREPEEDTIKFKVGAVLDYDEFEKLCPEPKPPVRIKQGQKEGIPNYDDKAYVKEFGDWVDRQLGWMYIKSLSATPGIEFDHVKLTDPTTWGTDVLKKELESAGLVPREVKHLINRIRQANAMDERRLEEARQRFFPEEPEANA